MKKALRIIVTLLLLASLLVLVPSGAIVAQAEIVELPLDAKEGMEPQDDGYVGEWEYTDPSISVKIESGNYKDTYYLVARIKIANGSQLRTSMAGSYWSPSTGNAVTMANRANAVFAINGDYYSQLNGAGYITRQGKEYRVNCTGKNAERFDVLVIDNLGDLHILPKATNESIEEFKNSLLDENGNATRTIVNTFTFGPALIIDGEPQPIVEDKQKATHKAAQRMCLAQVGPLEYLCIASEGPECVRSTGLTLEEFSELVCSFEEIQNAYNLDGGSSTSMVFRKQDEKSGTWKNDKINSPLNPKRRPVNDIIYFASAWQSEE